MTTTVARAFDAAPGSPCVSCEQQQQYEEAVVSSTNLPDSADLHLKLLARGGGGRLEAHVRFVQPIRRVDETRATE